MSPNKSETQRNTEGAKFRRSFTAPLAAFSGHPLLDVMHLRIRRRKTLSKGLRREASPLLLGDYLAHGHRSTVPTYVHPQTRPRPLRGYRQRMGVPAGDARGVHDEHRGGDGVSRLA